ncbi:MAG: hypothetical protein HFH51_13085 [Lachnospiraceae bacterium]|nr:hypothetical protein [Lachnospiraceae bacterium]
MGQDLVLIGAGGCMREILWQIEELNKENSIWKVQGYVDKQPCIINGSSQIQVGNIQCPYLGTDDYLLSRKKDTNVAISVGEPSLRKQIAEKLKRNPNLKFPNLILNNAKICGDIQIGQGCILSMDCRVSTGVVLGDFVFLNIGVLVCHDSVVGEFTTLSPDVKIAGKVTIGKKCDIGLGSRVIQGIAIGTDVVAGAGSVIVNDIADGCRVAGVPAKPLR